MVGFEHTGKMSGESCNRTLNFPKSIDDGLVVFIHDRQLGVDGGDLLPHEVTEPFELVLL